MRKLKLKTGSLATEIGVVQFAVGPAGLVSLTIDDAGAPLPEVSDDGLDRIKVELAEYFAGLRRNFSLPVDLARQSDFSRQVVAALLEVGYGETVTYGELAVRAGHPRAARAVGRVMAGNRLPIVIPCHRVVGRGGRLTGYSGGHGVATKEWLLAHEQRVVHGCHNDPH